MDGKTLRGSATKRQAYFKEIKNVEDYLNAQQLKGSRDYCSYKESVVPTKLELAI